MSPPALMTTDNPDGPEYVSQWSVETVYEEPGEIGEAVRQPAYRSSPSALPSPSRHPLAVAALLGVAILSLLLLLIPGSVMESDGQSMLQVTRSLVERGDVTVSAPHYGELIGVRGLGGRLYSKYGPGQSIAAIPLWLVGRALASLIPPSLGVELPVMAASTLPAIAVALSAALLLLTALELGASLAGAIALALVYSVTTPALVYATQWFSEPLTGCALLAAFYLLLRDRRVPTWWGPLAAGVAMACAVATRSEVLVLTPTLVVYAVLSTGPQPGRRRQRLLGMLVPLVMTLAALGLYNLARFGSPFETGYSYGDVFAYRDTHPAHSLASFVQGVYGLVLSPGKGLLEYAPVMALAPFAAVILWRRRRAETALLLALIGLQLVGHANLLISWLGGWSWGPRFLVPVLPFMTLLLVPLFEARGRLQRPPRWNLSRARGLFAVLALAGVLVQLPAVVIHEPHIYLYDQFPLYCAHRDVNHCPSLDQARLEHDYVYAPTHSPIVGSWALLFDHNTWTPQTRMEPDRVARQGVVVAPHTWWRLLSLQGVPTPPLAIVCVLLGLLSALSLTLALRIGRAPQALTAAQAKTDSTTHWAHKEWETMEHQGVS